MKERGRGRTGVPLCSSRSGSLGTLSINIFTSSHRAKLGLQGMFQIPARAGSDFESKGLENPLWKPVQRQLLGLYPGMPPTPRPLVSAPTALGCFQSPVLRAPPLHGPTPPSHLGLCVPIHRPRLKDLELSACTQNALAGQLAETGPGHLGVPGSGGLPLSRDGRVGASLGSRPGSGGDTATVIHSTHRLPRAAGRVAGAGGRNRRDCDKLPESRVMSYQRHNRRHK